MLAELREDAGLDPDPVAAYARSGYAERIVAERVGGTQAGWGA
jgi:L-rhamnose isomerase/sugar isomerase